MKVKNIFFATFFLFIAVANTAAQTTVSKKRKQCVKLLDAYAIHAVPAVPGEPIKTENHFVVVWKDTKYPEAFFWRGAGGWQNCEISLAHRVPGGKHHAATTIDYTTEPLARTIHKGDTLELMPVAGGKFPIPGEIPKSARNTLYYKTEGGKWMPLRIKKIEQKTERVVR